jgi:hypothetical protein
LVEGTVLRRGDETGKRRFERQAAIFFAAAIRPRPVVVLRGDTTNAIGSEEPPE